MKQDKQQQLQEEIAELRGELGETVEALAHKADVPTRTKQRVRELKDEAVQHGSELGERMVERGGQLRDQAAEAANRSREAINQAPSSSWLKLAGAGLALVLVLGLVRRLRRCGGDQG